MIRWSASLLASLILLAGCTNGGGSNTNGPYGESIKQRKATAAELRESIKKWAPHLTTGWEVPFQAGENIRRLWVNQEDVLVETDKYVLWQIKRKSGDMKEQFALRIGSSREVFEIGWRPVRSQKRLYLIGKGYLFVLDEYMNLLDHAQLDFVPASDPSANDANVFIGTYERFFYGYDWANKQYKERKRLEGPARARSVTEEGRVYFCSNDPQNMRVHALSSDPQDFFKEIWSKRIHDTVTAPLSVHPHAANLYVGSDNGTLFCYSKHSGRIIWFAETEGAIRQQPLGHADRVYAIAEDGPKQGLWCIQALSTKGEESNVLWRYDAGRQILAIGKQQLYVRIEHEGGAAIAVVRAKDGSVAATLPVHPKFKFFLTNTHAAQIVLATEDGYVFTAYEE